MQNNDVKFLPVECVYSKKLYTRCYDNRDYWKYYLSSRRYPCEIDYKRYSKLLEIINKLIMKSVTEGCHVILPIGTLKVVRKRTNPDNLQVDMKRSKQMGFKTLAYHMNQHTNFEYVKYKWVKFLYIKNAGLFRFIPSRTNKRILSRLLINDPSYIGKYTTSRERVW